MFTVVTCGLNPKIALGEADSGEPRFSRICRMIEECRYGIHDISRMKSSKKGELFRLNMPFELGLDIGAKIFNPRKHNLKRHLILEKEKYRFQAALSDLSNSDIRSHSNDPARLVGAVRNWLANNGAKNLPSPTSIWYSFNDFLSDFFEKRTRMRFTKEDLYELPVRELIDQMRDWRNKRKTR